MKPIKAISKTCPGHLLDSMSRVVRGDRNERRKVASARNLHTCRMGRMYATMCVYSNARASYAPAGSFVDKRVLAFE